MPNYREAILEGVKRWRRSYMFVGYNHYGAVPPLSFLEEDLTELEPGEMLAKQHGVTLTATMSAPDTVFDVMNPETDEVIGSATYLDLQVMLHSLYRHLADERDNQAQQP